MLPTNFAQIAIFIAVNRVVFGQRATFVLADTAARERLLSFYRKA